MEYFFRFCAQLPSLSPARNTPADTGSPLTQPSLVGAGGCSCPGRVILSGEGDSAHPHKPLQAQRRHFHPPKTITPSKDIPALQRQTRPPKRLETPATDSPKRRWRVFLSREGDFVRGGRFCTPPQATPGTTQTFPPSRDIYALQGRISPPE